MAPQRFVYFLLAVSILTIFSCNTKQNKPEITSIFEGVPDSLLVSKVKVNSLIANPANYRHYTKKTVNYHLLNNYITKTSLTERDLVLLNGCIQKVQVRYLLQKLH